MRERFDDAGLAHLIVDGQWVEIERRDEASAVVRLVTDEQVVARLLEIEAMEAGGVN